MSKACFIIYILIVIFQFKYRPVTIVRVVRRDSPGQILFVSHFPVQNPGNQNLMSYTEYRDGPEINIKCFSITSETCQIPIYQKKTLFIYAIAMMVPLGRP